MQFRFRQYDEENDKYNLISITNIKDYDTMFKTLTYMQEHQCEFPIEVNMKNIVETPGKLYTVSGVSLCVSNNYGEDGLLPHFVVDVEETF